jgi:predicted transcriptional regulator
MKTMDDNDLEFAEILKQIGVPRSVAMIITYLKDLEEASSRDIEIGGDLRQPEVSIGMRELRRRDWIEEREFKTEGKGRPSKIYSLKVTIDEIIRQFEEEKQQEAANDKDLLRRLRDIQTEK